MNSVGVRLTAIELLTNLCIIDFFGQLRVSSIKEFNDMIIFIARISILVSEIALLLRKQSASKGFHTDE